MRTAAKAAELLGFPGWFDYQEDAFTQWEDNAWQKMLVFYPTGSGKTEVMLTCMWLRGHNFVTVVAPPVTHARWREVGKKLGMTVRPMSHARFRMKSTLFARDEPMIVDEFHLLGGRKGAGWNRLDRFARGTKGDLIIGSATPNYNDAERCYCIAHVLDPHQHKGGYLQWLYTHCITQQNQFRNEPDVIGFKHFKDAADFLSSLNQTVYLEDTAPDILVDVEVQSPLPSEFHTYGYDESRKRIMASQMEERQRTRFLQIVDPSTDAIRDEVYEMLITLTGNAQTPSLIFCNRVGVAGALCNSLADYGVEYGYVDGTMSTKQKDFVINQFKQGVYDVLVGTATLATGTDGIDKMCNELIILDDTDDNALRRQLIGRILPRGGGDATGKWAHRISFV